MDVMYKQVTSRTNVTTTRQFRKTKTLLLITTMVSEEINRKVILFYLILEKIPRIIKFIVTTKVVQQVYHQDEQMESIKLVIERKEQTASNVVPTNNFVVKKRQLNFVKHLKKIGVLQFERNKH